MLFFCTFGTCRFVSLGFKSRNFGLGRHIVFKEGKFMVVIQSNEQIMNFLNVTEVIRIDKTHLISGNG